MPKWIPRLHDPVWLRAEYERGRTTTDIAAELGCARTAAIAALKRHGIAARAGGRAAVDPRARDGAWLRAQYEGGKSTRLLAKELKCSQRVVWETLTAAGVEFRGTGKRGRPSAQPYLVAGSTGGRAKYLHRQVMEAHLGRKLLRSEHVHHLDGDTRNNAIDNLTVLTASQHHSEHSREMAAEGRLGSFLRICWRCEAYFRGGWNATLCKPCR